MLAPSASSTASSTAGMRGLAKGHTDIESGDYAIVAMEPGWITNRQIEAARVAITRHIRRGGKVDHHLPGQAGDEEAGRDPDGVGQGQPGGLGRRGSPAA